MQLMNNDLKLILTQRTIKNVCVSLHYLNPQCKTTKQTLLYSTLHLALKGSKFIRNNNTKRPNKQLKLKKQKRNPGQLARALYCRRCIQILKAVKDLGK